MNKLHYKEFIAENHHHYTVPINDIHFIFFKNQKYQLQLLHDDRHSSVPRLFKLLPMRSVIRPAHEW
jgi:hypothetical protein